MVPETALDTATGGGQDLWPLLIYTALVAGVLAVVYVGSWLLGARTPRKKATDMPFESGILPVGQADETRLSVEFYLIAMFFVIFDLETIFIFAWAVAFFELGWRGYAGAGIFIAILLVALVYELRTGALDWGLKQRLLQRHYATTGRTSAGSRRQ